MTTGKQNSKSSDKKLGTSRSTRRKNKIAKSTGEFEKLDHAQRQQFLLEKYDGEVIERIPQNDVEDDVAERSNFVEMINQRFDPIAAADLLVREILYPKSMKIPIDEVTTVKRLNKRAPRDKHDNSTFLEAYELRLMRPNIDAFPKMETRAEFIRIAMWNFELFADRLNGLCLEVPDGQKLENHINSYYRSIKIIVRSTPDARLQNMILYYTAVLAARLFFHQEAKVMLGNHRDRLKSCSAMIQKLEAAEMFGNMFYANKTFWNTVVDQLDRKVEMIPRKIVDYAPLEPELSYIVNFCDILGYKKLEELLFLIFRRLGAYKTINPGVIYKSIKRSILKRLRSRISIRRIMMNSVKALEIPQGLMPEELEE